MRRGGVLGGGRDALEEPPHEDEDDRFGVLAGVGAEEGEEEAEVEEEEEEEDEEDAVAAECNDLLGSEKSGTGGMKCGGGATAAAAVVVVVAAAFCIARNASRWVKKGSKKKSEGEKESEIAF